MYRRVAASASAAVLAAAAAIPTLRQEQEEQESSLRRGLSSADGSSTLGDHGVGGSRARGVYGIAAPKLHY